jgi:hypothetical protein
MSNLQLLDWPDDNQRPVSRGTEHNWRRFETIAAVTGALLAAVLLCTPLHTDYDVTTPSGAKPGEGQIVRLR